MSAPEAKKLNERDVIASFMGAGKKLFCYICKTELLPDKSCPKCGVYYTGQTAEHEQKIRALDNKKPGPRQMLSARVDEPWLKAKERKTKMDPLFESLEGKGFKFTSYNRTDE